jgi:hypothetical protein
MFSLSFDSTAGRRGVEASHVGRGDGGDCSCTGGCSCCGSRGSSLVYLGIKLSPFPISQVG